MSMKTLQEQVPREGDANETIESIKDRMQQGRNREIKGRVERNIFKREWWKYAKMYTKSNVEWKLTEISKTDIKSQNGSAIEQAEKQRRRERRRENK